MTAFVKKVFFAEISVLSHCKLKKLFKLSQNP